MGSDGHIRIYDYYKVQKILNEMNKEIPDREDWLRFPGYVLDWTVNNQQACLIYWDRGINRPQTHPEDKGGYGFDGQWAQQFWFYKRNAKEKGGYYKKLSAYFQEFEKRCDEEAVIVSDQQVWT